ncbi:MAG TPA: DNA recombination protein RmuC [Propionibacteriaceae bacterium]|nr:DNA recombination protein RmuC [Propionibacteriaceae bacterium]
MYRDSVSGGVASSANDDELGGFIARCASSFKKERAASDVLSSGTGKILAMDGLTVIVLIGGLVVGLSLGSVAGWLIARARQQADSAQGQMLIAQSHGEAATARAEAAHARAEAAQARSDVAEARTEAAAAQAEAAQVSAEVARAIAQRDAALDRVKEISADRESMINQFRVLSAETIDRQGQAADVQAALRLRATEQLMTPVRESLEKFNFRLTEVEKERAAMSAELRSQVSYVQQTGETLRRETAALVNALRKPQIRGSWGETQLKRVAELAGMIERCDFDLQYTTKDNDRVLRPDMRVNLSEGKHVFVDAKVPLNSFLEAAETDDPQLKSDALARYARNVRTHIDQLSSKQYWKAAETPEFVVLFLPNEMFFTTALDQIPDLYDYAAARDVVLATPTTLIGMLRAVAYGWRQAALAESANEVFRLGRELHEKLGLLGNRFDKLGRALRSSVNAYNETIATVEGTVLVRARRFRDLKVSEKELPGPTQIDEPVRQIQAAELVDDAVQVEPMVGRSRRRRSTAIPEAAELYRSDPDLTELIEEDSWPEPDRGAQSS